jgi:polar amino acid transport system substrate-binding protein
MKRMRGPNAVLLVCFSSASLLAADTPVNLAPTGTLRATFLGLNPVQGTVDPKTGAITGPVADIVKELARKLGVAYAILPQPNAQGVIDGLKNHIADIGFLAYDEKRAAEVDFAGTYALMYNAYVVPADSPIRKTADADRAGVRIGAVRGQTQELYLSGNIKNGQVRVFETMPPQAELERLLVSGELQAFGLNRQRAETAAASPKLRAIEDNFLVVEQAIIVEKGDPAKLDEINRLMDELRASGYIKASLDRARISGVDVAPARKK